MQLSQKTAWKKLEKHAQSRPYLSSSPSIQSSPLKMDLLQLDYAHQQIDCQTLELLGQLAEECRLKLMIEQLMAGGLCNHHLPALHTLLRDLNATPFWYQDINIKEAILSVRERMRFISTQIRNAQWLGYSGQPITDVVNLGIGGSMLGPQFCMDAFTDIKIPTIGFHFISDYDEDAFLRVLNKLNPETTLFIVSSKSFATAETLLNAKKALLWGKYKTYDPQHFIAVTAQVEKAQALGFQQILPIWPWIGGRFSVCSAINLITCIAIGYDYFLQFLAGAAQMDAHFLAAPPLENLPIMLALLGIWNNNHLKIHNLLILTYAQSLQWFVPYLQQLEMESNGKSIDRQGRAVNYATVPIIWGGSGNQAQHSYFQMLAHGTHRLSADLISLNSLDNRLIEQHREALLNGIHTGKLPHRYIPCNHIQLVDNSPQVIGALIALYEHKVFVQAVIWNINPFDQPGVEKMKEKMEKIT